MNAVVLASGRCSRDRLPARRLQRHPGHLRQRDVDHLVVQQRQGVAGQIELAGREPSLIVARAADIDPARPPP